MKTAILKSVIVLLLVVGVICLFALARASENHTRHQYTFLKDCITQEVYSNANCVLLADAQ